MANYLLDTNHASPLVTHGHPLRDRVQRAIESGHSFGIAVPALSELLFGIGLLPRAAHNQTEWTRIRQEIACYAVDEFDAQEAAELRILLRKQGLQLMAIDAFIAVIALRYDLTLLTTDHDFIPVPGLKTENWIKRPPK